eukprot:scaffold673_cov410-Prasinococcus_capsulatus_cf.AAC.9
MLRRAWAAQCQRWSCLGAAAQTPPPLPPVTRPVPRSRRIILACRASKQNFSARTTLLPTTSQNIQEDA